MSGLRIFDSYPLLAWLQNERSALVVDAMLDEAMALREPNVAALGIANHAQVMTGDPELRAMTPALSVEWIGPAAH